MSGTLIACLSALALLDLIRWRSKRQKRGGKCICAASSGWADSIRLDRQLRAYLSLAHTARRFLVAEVDFYIPALEVGFDDLARISARVCARSATRRSSKTGMRSFQSRSNWGR